MGFGKADGRGRVGGSPDATAKPMPGRPTNAAAFKSRTMPPPRAPERIASQTKQSKVMPELESRSGAPADLGDDLDRNPQSTP